MLFCFNQGESQPSSACTQRDPVCAFLVCEMGIVLQWEEAKTNKVSPSSSLSRWDLKNVCILKKSSYSQIWKQSCQIEKNRCILNVSKKSLCLFANCNSEHVVKGSLYSLGKGRCVFTCWWHVVEASGLWIIKVLKWPQGISLLAFLLPSLLSWGELLPFLCSFPPRSREEDSVLSRVRRLKWGHVLSVAAGSCNWGVNDSGALRTGV